MAAQEKPGGNGNVVSVREYVDVKVEGVRSELQATRSDLQASIADLRADLKALAARVEELPTTWTMVGTIAGGFSVSMGLLFTFLTFVNGNADYVRAQQRQLDEAVALSIENNRKLTELTDKLDQTISNVQKNSQNISELTEKVDVLSSRMEQLIDTEERETGRKR